MIAVVFPGQGSQKPGMGNDFFKESQTARRVFEAVRSATELDIAKLCFESDDETLRQTQNAQLALFTCGVAAFRVLSERLPTDISVRAMAGHSVGEYASLVAAGILSVEDGARLVQRRGDLMARSGNLRRGGMAAVLGLDREILEQICTKISTKDGVVVIANDNSPGQIVISGDYDALLRAEPLLIERGAKRVLMLNVSGAFHSPLMDAPAEAMGQALKRELFRPWDASVRVYSNVTSDIVEAEDSWPALLEAQLRSPVRWVESVQNMIRDGVNVLLECGTGEVLCGLVKRISREVKALPVNDLATLDKALEALA